MSVSFGPDFRRNGPELPYGVADVSYDDVLPLRTRVLGEFIEGSSTKATSVTFDETSRGGALFFRSIGEPGKETPNRSVAARVVDTGIPDGWRFSARISTYSREAGITRSNFVYYFIETMGDQVFNAVKATGRIEEKSEILVSGDDIDEVVVAERTMQEEPLTADDCSGLITALERAVHRAPYRSRDPLAIIPLSLLEDGTIRAVHEGGTSIIDI